MTNNGYPKSGVRTPEAKARREAHWRTVLERWRTSGLAKTEFARRARISPDVLGWWLTEIRKRDQAPRQQAAAPRPRGRTAKRPASFVPVRVVKPVSAPTPAALEILAGGHTVRIRPGFDTETLKRLVAVLEDRA